MTENGKGIPGSPGGTWLLFLVSLVIGFGTAEMILRVFVDQETKRLATFDGELGWRGKPNGEGVYVRSEDGIRAAFRYNPQGFRDEPFGAAEHAGPRILLLGDSFLEALEVEYEQTFHRILELRLKEEFGEKADVAIIASQGYSTAQELLGMRKYWESLRPDLVILVFYTGNDFRENMRRDFAYLDAEGTLQFPRTKRSDFDIWALSAERWLYEHSHVVFFAKNTYESLTGRRAAATGREIEKASYEKMLATTRLLITTMAEDVRNRGALFGIAVLQSGKEIESGDNERLQDIVDICDDAAIPCLPFEEKISTQDLFPVDGHLNQTGHRVVAANLYRFIDEQFPEVRERRSP